MSLTGITLGGRYEVGEKLGAGGMAIVYRAQDALLQRPVTVKVLRGEFVADENVVKRFRREAQAAAALSHPNIVAVYDVGRQDDTHYIVMEYIQGQTLKEFITERGPLPVEDAVRIARQIAEALRHAHTHRIIHRDVKPHNVLLTHEGRVKVADFGIAGAATGSTVTYAGTLVGTVYYVSPEQAQGRYGDERSDLYALGVVLYEMLTGQVPFEGESPVSVALKHIRETVPPPRELNPRIPPAAERVVMKAMAKEVERRYQNAVEMIRDLEALQRQLAEWRSRGQLPATPTPAPGTARDRTQVIATTPAKATREDATRPGNRAGGAAARMTGSAAAGDHAAAGGATDGAGGRGDGQPGDGGGGGRGGEGFEPIDSYLDLDDARVPTARPGRRWSRSTVWIASFAAFLVLTGVALFSVVQWFEVPEVTVPNVVGLEIDQAHARLREHRLNGDVVAFEFNPDVAAGVVISQTPASGATVKVNRPIKLWVSKGPEVVSVPNVVGQTWREAKINLESDGLVVNENDFSFAFSDTFEKDRVISQTPPAGTSNVPRGTEVKLVVSKGPQSGTVVIPNFIGQTLDQARVLAETLGLLLGEVIIVESDREDGIVVGQAPMSGTTVAAGSAVSLTVSGDPAQPGTGDDGSGDPGTGGDTGDTGGGGSDGGTVVGQNQALVHFIVPASPPTQTVRIVVRDAAGERTVYGEREHAAGYEGWILVNFVGETLHVMEYYDGALTREYDHDAGSGQ